jgi:RNA polymerase sigma factor (sigma-70 family)
LIVGVYSPLSIAAILPVGSSRAIAVVTSSPDRQGPVVSVPRDDELLAATPSRPAAFAEFYRRHERLVLAYLRQRTGDAETAADLAAETFAAALVSAGRFRPRREPAIAWLLGIARNKWLHARRSGAVEDRARKRLAMEPLVLEEDMLAGIDALVGEGWADAMLASLPVDQAEAIRARVLEERSYSEIAVSLRCSPAVVRQRVSRGLAALRAATEGDR